MKYRYFSSLPGLILLLGLLLTACGDEATSTAALAANPLANTVAATSAAQANPKLPAIPAGQTVTIQFASYNFGTPGLGGKGTQQLIDEFQAKNPNIKVEGRNVPVLDLIKTITAEAAAGNPPDIAQLGLNSIDFVVNSLPVVAINKIVPREEYDDYTKHLVPQALNLGIYNGDLYAGAYTFSTPTLFYNADIFKAAGLDPDKPPTTWDEVRQYGMQIKEKTGKSAIIIDSLPPSGDWIIQSLINSNGGTSLSADKKRATFNEAPAIEVFKMWQSFVKDGLQPKLNPADAQAAMNNGNLAMLITSTVLLPAFSDAAKGKYDLRTAGEPAFGNKKVRPVNSGSGLFMFSKDPLKQRAAWEFLKFVASQRGMTIITSVIGYLPLRDDVIDDPNYLKPFLEKEPRMLPTIKQLSNLETWVSWPGKNSNQATQVYYQAIFDVVYDGQDAQKTMDTAAARVTELLQAK